jgi:hypothetical protein
MELKALKSQAQASNFYGNQPEACQEHVQSAELSTTNQAVVYGYPLGHC